VGTEFAVFFTIDEGKKWVQLKSGLPTTQVRDIAIQQRENDLVLATFGRGFYILDNYTPLRELTPGIMKKDSHIFPIKDALMFILGSRGLYGQGDTFFKAPNPEFGATFTYFLKKPVKTLKKKRKAAEKAAMKKGEDIKYPTVEEFRAEEEETKPYLLFTIKDETGREVRRLKSPVMPGLHRLTWDLRYPSFRPPRESGASSRGRGGGSGAFVMPGTYTVSLEQYADGKLTPMAGPQSFVVKPLNIVTLPAKDRKAMVEFQKKLTELARAVQGTTGLIYEQERKIKLIKSALDTTPEAPPDLMKQALAIEKQLKEIRRALSGDEILYRRNENQPPSITSRLFRMAYGYSSSTADPTRTMKDQYRIIGEEFEPQLEKLEKLIEVDMKKLETAMEEAGAPWTPGRIPKWKK
jgi:hypothetical protein